LVKFAVEPGRAGASITTEALEDFENRDPLENKDGEDGFRLESRVVLGLLVNELRDPRFISLMDRGDDSLAAGAMSIFARGAVQSWSLQRSCRREPPSSFASCDVARTRILFWVSNAMIEVSRVLLTRRDLPDIL
jgi:hypothetical protein